METHTQRHNDSGCAVKKTQSKKIILKEFADRVKNYLKHIGFYTLIEQFLSSDIGVKIYFLDQRLNGLMGIVVNN